MAVKSQDIRRQMQAYTGNNVPAMIEQGVKQQYEGPMKQLISEGQRAREAYYPEFFNAAERYGTGAGNMSPAARLRAMVADSERLGGRYRNNLDLRNYYGTSINDAVNRAMQGYQMGYQSLRDQWQQAFQDEQAQERNRLARASQAQQNSLAQMLAQLRSESVQTPTSRNELLRSSLSPVRGAAFTAGIVPSVNRGIRGRGLFNRGLRGQY